MCFPAKEVTAHAGRGFKSHPLRHNQMLSFNIRFGLRTLRSSISASSSVGSSVWLRTRRSGVRIPRGALDSQMWSPLLICSLEQAPSNYLIRSNFLEGQQRSDDHKDQRQNDPGEHRWQGNHGQDEGDDTDPTEPLRQ